MIRNKFIIFQIRIIRVVIAFSIGWVLALLIAGCERRPLEDMSRMEAMIPITIDWRTKAMLDPDNDRENLYCASVYFFSKDGPVFNGNPWCHLRMEQDVTRDSIMLPIGRYQVLVFNNSPTDFPSHVGFRGTDRFDTFEYYLVRKSASMWSEGSYDEPDILAAMSIFDYEVTPNMVYRTRTDGSSLSAEEKAEADRDLRKLLNLQPERLTQEVHAQLAVENLNDVSYCQAIYSATPTSVKLATREYSTERGSLSFELTSRIFDHEQKLGFDYMEQSFRILGMLPQPKSPYRLALRFRLRGTYEGGEYYPSILQEPMQFDVREQLMLQPAPDADRGFDRCIHLSGIKIPPIVTGGGMFDPKVDSWQEEEYDVPMGKSRRKNNNINKM